MVGGDILKYWSKCIIKLERYENDRKATLVKHRSLPENLNFFFKITKKEAPGIPSVKLSP